MNYHQLTRDEAAFIIFSFKKTLRDPNGLTPQMQQFYERSLDTLSRKVDRLDRSLPERGLHVDEAPTGTIELRGAQPRF